MKPISKEEIVYWTALSSTPGIGPITFFKLIKIFGSAKKAWFSTQKTMENHKFSSQVSILISRRNNSLDPFEFYSSIIKGGIETVCLLEKKYPKLLKNINNPPPVLYYQGTLKEIDNRSLAVVGTRKPSSKGRATTKKLVSHLSKQNITIISGLARGIDGVAHQTALENNGRTVAFLGGGIDRIYPAEHKFLASKIIQNGCIFSEYPPGISPQRGSFLARNRLISGMSLGVLIIEGLSKSGTTNTANHAKKQNKPVFIVSESKSSSLSSGPKFLLKQGAIKVNSADDILNHLNLRNNDAQKKEKSRSENNISKEEQIILDLLKNNSLETDQIINLSGLNTTTVLTTLSKMEIKAVIKNNLGRFQRV